jgi:hypothetical protein
MLFVNVVDMEAAVTDDFDGYDFAPARQYEVGTQRDCRGRYTMLGNGCLTREGFHAVCKRTGVCG